MEGERKRGRESLRKSRRKKHQKLLRTISQRKLKPVVGKKLIRLLLGTGITA